MSTLRITVYPDRPLEDAYGQVFQPRHCSHSRCPVALAVCRATGVDVGEIYVDSLRIETSGGGRINGRVFSAPTPRDVAELIAAYDRWGEMPAFSFTLEAD
jgi:hypothetical protein